jgi:RimJ/RimL family protein N-acetyltransferase
VSPSRPEDVRLVTERMVLRRFTADDVDLLVALDADPDVMRYVTGGLATPRREIEEEVLPAWLAWHERSDHLGFFAAEDRETGAFLGWFHLRPGEGRGEDEPELGYRLRREAWGRGLATEGSRGLVDDAFTTQGARRVTAETMVVNTASRRVMEKVGMRLVRTFHGDWPYPIPGDEHGDVEYAITRAEWEGRADDV